MGARAGGRRRRIVGRHHGGDIKCDDIECDDIGCGGGNKADGAG